MKILFALLALIVAVNAAPGMRKVSSYDNTKLIDRSILFPFKLFDPIQRSNSKIVGGEEAIPHEFPAQVALNIDGLYFCGGSLISDSWVLTAAHCCLNANFAVVTAGAHNQDIDEPSQVIVNSKQIIGHENFGYLTAKNDVCLIELEEAVPLNEFIAPIPLGTEFIDGGVEVTAAGWGKDADGPGGVHDTLKKVVDHTITNQQCEDQYGLLVHEDVLCIAYEDGGTCSGDSGGPLMTGTSPDDRILVGVTSYGSSAGCTSGAPDAFQRVAYHLEWIENNSGVTPP